MLVALVGGCTPTRSTPTPQPSEYQFPGIHDVMPGQGRSDPVADPAYPVQMCRGRSSTFSQSSPDARKKAGQMSRSRAKGEHPLARICVSVTANLADSVRRPATHARLPHPRVHQGLPRIRANARHAALVSRRTPAALADLDGPVAAITVDAYGDDEPQIATSI
jgi:hypothetical protein